MWTSGAGLCGPSQEDQGQSRVTEHPRTTERSSFIHSSISLLCSVGSGPAEDGRAALSSFLLEALTSESLSLKQTDTLPSAPPDWAGPLDFLFSLG